MIFTKSWKHQHFAPTWRTEKSEKSVDDKLVYVWEDDLQLGNLCEKGSQLRPHIVWFGEEVPAISSAQKLVSEADIVMVIGTSLQVYPAAGLMYEARKTT